MLQLLLFGLAAAGGVQRLGGCSACSRALLFWVRADRSGLAAAFSPAGALPWQDEEVLMADMAEEMELKITKR